MNIHKKIRQIRLLKGFSQEYMAVQLRISQAAYSKLEGNPKIGKKRIHSIATIFNITPQQLHDFEKKALFKTKQTSSTSTWTVKERKLLDKKITDLESEIDSLRKKVTLLIESKGR